MKNKETDLARYFRSIGIRPTFTNNKIFGNLYVVENLMPYSKFPERFIAVSDKTNKFYFVDCICCDEKEKETEEPKEKETEEPTEKPTEEPEKEDNKDNDLEALYNVVKKITDNSKA